MMLGSAPGLGAPAALLGLAPASRTLPGPTEGFGSRAEPSGRCFGCAVTPRRFFALWSIFHPPAASHLHGAAHNVVF